MRNGDSTFFVHGMGGGVEIDANIFDTAWAIGGGAGLDFNINDAMNVRVFQGDYIMSFFGGETQNSFRVSAGIVFKLGVR